MRYDKKITADTIACNPKDQPRGKLDSPIKTIAQTRKLINLLFTKETMACPYLSGKMSSTHLDKKCKLPLNPIIIGKITKMDCNKTICDIFFPGILEKWKDQRRPFSIKYLQKCFNVNCCNILIRTILETFQRKKLKNIEVPHMYAKIIFHLQIFLVFLIIINDIF